MTRLLGALVLTCLVTACAPKATEVAEEPVTPPKRNQKPAATTTDAPPEMPRVVNPDGMQIPDIVGKLPDRKDMTPTAPPATGGAVIATPPEPKKPVNE